MPEINNLPLQWRELKMKTIGQYLKEKRETLGFSMEYVAQELNISYPSYHAYESGKTNLFNPRFITLCVLLKIDPCDLITKTTNVKFYRQPENIDIAREKEVKYFSESVADLKKELRERDELIGALKYQLNQLTK